MAGGGKEYTLTFLLKAAADSSYQAAFAKAKQELNQFQQQIQSNNTLLKDISAYQRQEQAVQRAAEKVAEKTSALERARAAAEAAGHADEKLNAAQLKAEAAYKTATERLNQQEQKLKTQGDALRQAGVNTGNLSGEQARLAKETENLKIRQEELADSQNRMLQSMAEMEAMAAEAYVVIQAVEKLGEAWKACVDAASGFQYAMSATEAVTQATAGEMEQLTAVAKETGATTIFTATEIASAMEYMGLAGWSAQEMIEGIPSVANLAAAAGEDLSRVCDIVTDAMMALGYGTEDTARFCDVLAQTARTANTNVDKMGDSLKYVSSTAGAMHYSIEDVATAMADLANSGIKGSMAGTALRNILASLADPSDEASAALEELDIHLSDTEGNLYGLNDVITQLRSGFRGLTGEQKTQYASMIAGKRGMAGVLALVNTSQEAYDQLAATINDCSGAAEKMAKTRLDNFQGSVTLLESAWDALKTSIGETYLDAGAKAADTLTLMANGANDFVKENETLVISATAAAGAFGAMAIGVAGVTAAIKLLNGVFAGTILANPALWGAAAIAAGAAGIAAAIVHIGESAKNAGKSTEELLEEIQIGEEKQSLIEEYNEVSEAMKQTGLSAEETAEYESWLADVTGRLKEEYPELLGNIEAGTEAWNLNTAAILANIEATKQENLSELASHADAIAKGFVNASEDYEEASQNADNALNNMQGLEDVDFEDTIDKVQRLYDSLTGDIEKGKIEIDLEEGSDFYSRMQEIQNTAQNVSGVKLDWSLPSDVSEWLERNRDGAAEAADAMAVYGREYSDAMGEMAESSGDMEENARKLREIAEAGYSIASVLEDNGLTLGEIGLTSEEIGRQVATGFMTAEDACYRYGLSVEEVNRHVQGYYQRMTVAGEATGKATGAAKLSENQFRKLTYALEYVSAETLTAEQASKIFGIELEDLNEALVLQEEYEKNVAGAVAAVDNGLLSAETAADRFGVSLEAMDAYRAQSELEALQEELDALGKAYDSAYDSALSSIQGQGSLLEGLSLDAERTKLTLTDALSNMQEIESYWSTYSTNMEMLQGYGLSTDFLTRFCDTSADGVANTQDLADRLGSLSETDRTQWVEDLNTAFQSMADQEGITAGATADLENQYSTTAAAIEARISEMESSVTGDLNAMVGAMNQSGQAYTNGSATASAYVQGIRSQIEEARKAAAALTAAGTPSGGGSYYRPGKAHGGFTNGPELAGEDPRYPVEAVISFNPQYREENIGYLQMAAARLGVDMESQVGQGQTADWSGYEYGGLTEYGAAMLREWDRYSAEGRMPEAPVYIGSGAGAGNQISIAYSPTIQVSSGTTREELLQMLRQYDERLADRFEEIKSDAQRNERRTRYV